MKRWGVVLFAIATLMAPACKQPVKGKNGMVYANAINYNDYIISRQAEISKLSVKLSAETKNDLNAAALTVDSAVSVIDRNISEIAGMPAWKEDTTFRSAALALFKFYKAVFNNNYRRIINIQKDGTLSEDEKAGANYLMNEANKIESQLDADFKKAQQRFAVQNGLDTTKN